MPVEKFSLTFHKKITKGRLELQDPAALFIAAVQHRRTGHSVVYPISW